VRHAALAFAALLLLGCAPQQLAANLNGPAPVCAVKAGQRQSYWNEAVARRDGAMVLLAGECPAQPNSEGGGGGSGGM
jgi:hypothetical protein